MLLSCTGGRGLGAQLNSVRLLRSNLRRAATGDVNEAGWRSCNGRFVIVHERSPFPVANRRQTPSR